MRDALIDLTGNIYGDIKVLGYAGNKYWNCICTCGKQLKIRKSSIKTNYTDYKCKHTALNKAKINPNFHNLLGKKFGDYTVTDYISTSKWECTCKCGYKIQSDTKYIESKYNNYKCRHVDGKAPKYDLKHKQFGDITCIEYIGNSVWKCICSCGKELELSTYTIKNKYKCKHLDISQSSTFIDLTNQRFGDLLVKEYIGDSYWKCECICGYEYIYESKYIRNNKANYKCMHLTGKVFGRLHVIQKLSGKQYKCKCDCGNEINVYSYNLTYGVTKSCGCLKDEQRELKLSKEDVIHKLNKYIDQYGKPMISQLENILGVSYFTCTKYIQTYSLEEYIENKSRSLFELSVFNSINVSNKIKNVRSLINNNRNNELDIYIPENKLAIECNGDYWHSDIYKDRYYHQNKTLACAKQGIRLIHIFEHEWNNHTKRNIILTMINGGNSIKFAREFKVYEILDTDKVIEFENSNHLQGYAASEINIAIGNSNNDILGLMTIGKPRFDNNYQYEIIRICYKIGTAIVGGTEKLFKYFIKNYSPTSIVTYVDISKFTGNSYLRLGFEVCNITEPNYKWINIETGDIVSRYKSQKQKLIKYNISRDNETEAETMSRLGYIRIYDSGNLKLKWVKDI